MEAKRISGSAGFYLLLAGMMLFVPLSWIIAAVAAAVHELGHFLAIWILTGQKIWPKPYTFSARMPLPEMSVGRELLCALAGPAAGLCLLLLARWLPRIAACALVQSAFNLLPMWPLDGGRVLACLMDLLLQPPTAQRFCRCVANTVRGILVVAAVFAAFRLKLGILPLAVAGIVVFPRK